MKDTKEKQKEGKFMLEGCHLALLLWTWMQRTSPRECRMEEDAHFVEGLGQTSKNLALEYPLQGHITTDPTSTGSTFSGLYHLPEVPPAGYPGFHE